MATSALPGLLEALDEPALLVARAGDLRHANAAALRLLGRRLDAIRGRPLAELATDPPEVVAVLLRRFAGSRQVLVGRLHLRDGEGVARRYQCRGCRLPDMETEGGPLLLLRLQDMAHDRFKLLTQKVVALNAEIRANKRIRLQLEAALEQRETLLRELHHRVKNNLQTLLGILSLAERGAAFPEAALSVRQARLRVEAMAVLQRLLYQRGDLASVAARSFLGELCANVERAFGRPGISVRVLPTEAQISLDLASILGLVVNELLTNAFKHGFPDRDRGEITVELREEPDGGNSFTLVVQDDGCGLDPESAAGTGLRLVRGLVGQIGGTCEVRGGSGLCWVIRLRDRQRSAARSLN